MAEKFVVYVSAPPEGVEAAGNRLAELLKLDPAKVQGLVRRLPAVVTRPVSEREARVAAERFQQAGFGAEIRTESGVPIGADGLATNGSLVVSPSDDASYTLEAVNIEGKRVAQAVSVTVTPLPGAPSITSFTIDRTSAGFGSDARPPLLTARAPYEMRSPPARSPRIAACCFQR